MAQRYGRNRQRAARDEIARLSSELAVKRSQLRAVTADRDAAMKLALGGLTGVAASVVDAAKTQVGRDVARDIRKAIYRAASDSMGTAGTFAVVIDKLDLMMLHEDGILSRTVNQWADAMRPRAKMAVAPDFADFSMARFRLELPPYRAEIPVARWSY